jgi:hypothetical protein
VKKLLVLSDLHLDLANHDPPDVTGVDMLVATGDISPGGSGLNWLLDNFSPYLPIVYVPGNHEYYKHNYRPCWRSSGPRLRAPASRCSTMGQ